MKTEKKLKLSIEELDNFGVYPEIIKHILEICNEEYSGDEKIDDIVKYLNSLT